MQSRLGRYVVLKHLASGGMADVLLGRTDGIEGFERHVVLKRIRPEHAKDQRFIRMFLDEARVAANLHHQNVVQVHDIGEAAGEYFIAMEYLHGEDVRTILSTASKVRQHVPLGCAMAVVSAAAAGLHYAHERRGPDKRPLGIVHRDISPSNILVGYDGSVKVVDFGIAKATTRQETRSSSLKGKISYMSPEQCKGSEVDRRSDVYSLGVVLYELATTTRLFKGESDYLVMDQIVNGRVTPPQQRRPELPNELAAIIMRAIAPDPERRYFTADELRIALDQFAAKASLTTATSAIASYMRKQFGEKPEPWLDIENKEFDSSFEDHAPAAQGSLPGKSWSELPAGAEDFRRSTGSIPRNSGPISAVPAVPNPEPAPRVNRLPSTPPPTESKMGWESQQPVKQPRGFSAGKLALICAPLLLLLGFAIWRFSAGSSEPVQAAIAPPPAAPAPAAAPVVTPIPEPPRAPTEVAVATTEPTPAPAAAKPAEQVSSRRSSASSSSSSSSSRRSSGSRVETGSSSNGKQELPAPSPAPVIPTPAPTPAPIAAVVPTPPPPPSPAPVIPTPASAPAAAASSAAPQTVTPTALDANRIGGDKDITPDQTTQAEIGRSGTDTINGIFKVCITADGSINTVAPLKTTGFAAYDSKIESTIRRSWKYRPFMIGGKATAVCTAVRVVYSQK